MVILSFVLTFILTLIFSKWFRALGFLDHPERFGYQRSPVPYGLGIVFFLNFLLLSLLTLDLDPKLISILVSGGLLTLMCFLDDRYQLSPYLRLLIQIMLAGFVVFMGVQIPALSNPFGDPFPLDQILWGSFAPLAFGLAGLWIVFTINAMNWLDGSPGIVSGVSAIAAFVLYLLSAEKNIHVIDQSTLSQMALILGSSTLAFLFFDFPKPKVLMGDSGTMFLGFMLAVMAIFSGGKLATVFIVLAIPLFDALWTIGRRLVQGKSPFHGDFQHFHHELIRAGLSDRQVNLFYFAVSLAFGLSALYLSSFEKMISLLVLFGGMVMLRTYIISKKRSG